MIAQIAAEKRMQRRVGIEPQLRGKRVLMLLHLHSRYAG